MILFLGGCRKFDEIEASKVEMNDVTIERGWDYIKMSGGYDYPVELETMTLYLSEKEDMSGAKTYRCGIDGKTFSVEADDLKYGTKYHYQYEYDNGYVKEKGEKGNAVTIDKPIVVTKDAGGITTISAVLTGEVTNNDAANEIEERGFCWATESQPTIAGTHHNCGGDTGVGTSTFSHNISNLQDDATYYFRAYIKTNFGVIYGEEKSFKTVEITLPTVATSNVTNIKASSATCGGNVTSDGNGTVTARGVCWSTNPNPMINDNKTNNGSGTGTFTSNLTNLTENTTYYVRAYATNEKGTSYGEERSFKTEEMTLPTVTTSYVSNITISTAICGGNVTSDGNGTVTARGVCWSTNPNPTINDNKTNNGSGTGTFTSNLTNLTENTTYYVRAYATNEKGTSYGEERSFKTEEMTLPTVTTSYVSNITISTAICGGNVTSDGNGAVTARGVCWSTSPNPTINDNKTNNGSGTGSFTSNLTNLTENTTYYVRAYATNEKGTSYGEERSFKTEEMTLPTVTTSYVSNITISTAICGGNVTSDGNGTVTARGVCWSTSPNPTINDNKTSDGSGTGTFTSNLTNLTDNTTYYVRAYATNEKGTSYGEEKSFKTADKYNGHDYVDLGLPSGLLWATCNVGANNPEDYGNYYAWGETTTKSYYTNDNSATHGLSISQLQSQGYIDGSGNLTPQHDAARANWGGTWRMPTKTELEELKNKCTWTWATQGGMYGYKVTGPNGNHIFLPAAGRRFGLSLYDAGEGGHCWSSTPNESDSGYAYDLDFDISGQRVDRDPRRNGLSVRPVSE